MIYCTSCGKVLHETAPLCPQCGKPQHAVAHPANIEAQAGPLWAAITSLVLGVLCVLAQFDDSDWDDDTLFGMVVFSIIGLALGVVSLNISKRGKGMSIAGIVMSAISLLFCLPTE